MEIRPLLIGLASCSSSETAVSHGKRPTASISDICSNDRNAKPQLGAVADTQLLVAISAACGLITAV